MKGTLSAYINKMVFRFRDSNGLHTEITEAKKHTPHLDVEQSDPPATSRLYRTPLPLPFQVAGGLFLLLSKAVLTLRPKQRLRRFFGQSNSHLHAPRRRTSPPPQLPRGAAPAPSGVAVRRVGRCCTVVGLQSKAEDGDGDVETMETPVLPTAVHLPKKDGGPRKGEGERCRVWFLDVWGEDRNMGGTMLSSRASTRTVHAWIRPATKKVIP